MRPPTCLLSLLAAFLAIAISTGSFANERLIGMTWRAVSIEGRGVLDRVRSEITIATDGKLSGRAGCNRLFSTSKIGGSSISFLPIGGTRMACERPVMRQETEFLRALMATRSFAFDKVHLTFRDAAGAELIRFVAQP